MPSDDGALNDPLDERVAEARDALLEDGENVVAQEMGDHGQAVVLTDARVMILKSGLTATGEFNGNRAGVYLLTEIRAVNVRKGPMGAVIQVCTEKQEQPAHSGPPDNVIAFGGAGRVKRCEAIAAQIELALGKPLTRTAPDRASLEAPPQVEQAVEEQVPVDASAPPIVEDETEEEPEESPEFGPNPNLPIPIKRQPAGVSRSLVLLAALTAVLLVGLATTSPIREPDASVQPAKTGRTVIEIRKQLAGIERYRSESAALVKQADEIAARLEVAAKSGDPRAITEAVSGDKIGELWAKASSRRAPTGLAGAKANIVNGLGGLRTTAAGLAGSVGSQGSSPDAAVPRKIASDRELISQGLREIDSMIVRVKAEMGDG